MNAVMPFEFEGCAVRIVLRDGEPWFVAADVARVLSVGRTEDAVRRLDDDEKGTDSIRTLGGSQRMTIISESGLYALILTSRKPAARRFRKWVTADVLPALRRTGRYEMPPAADPAPEAALPAVCGHALVPADSHDLTVREMNAWTGCVRLVRGLYGRQAARGVYGRSPLPAVPDEAGVIDILDLDGAACLAHLCSARVARTRLVLGDLVRVARDDAHTRVQLAQVGILVRPENWRGWVAIARAHPRLQRVYAFTPWAADWSTPLMRLPGARPSEGYVGGFDRQRVAVMVPVDVVDRVARERVPAV